ncbi:MAG TPA: FtsX-like permease family protein, partial [Bacteroidales bacterium]|nr:FtsX-like permease family protein [Bacteroidales bacterium]
LVLIGKSLADKTKLRERSRLVLTFQNTEGELISALFRVGGIYRSSNTSLDERNVFVHQTDLNEYIGQINTVNEIAIVGYDAQQASALSNRYKAIFPELSIRTWVEISPELAYTQQLTQTMLLFIIAIILFALTFGLINTMLMSVFERIRELGMLMAVGLNRKKVFSMIMLETTFLILPGAVAGMLLGFLTTLLTHKTGINLAEIGGESLNQWGFTSLVHPYLAPSFYAILTILVIVTAFLTSIYPAVKALRLKPSEAIRKE